MCAPGRTCAELCAVRGRWALFGQRRGEIRLQGLRSRLPSGHAERLGQRDEIGARQLGAVGRAECAGHPSRRIPSSTISHVTRRFCCVQRPVRYSVHRPSVAGNCEDRSPATQRDCPTEGRRVAVAQASSALRGLHGAGDTCVPRQTRPSTQGSSCPRSWERPRVKRLARRRALAGATGGSWQDLRWRSSVAMPRLHLRSIRTSFCSALMFGS
jgi:hypothetical protein